MNGFETNTVQIFDHVNQSHALIGFILLHFKPVVWFETHRHWKTVTETIPRMQCDAGQYYMGLHGPRGNQRHIGFNANYWFTICYELYMYIPFFFYVNSCQWFSPMESVKCLIRTCHLMYFDSMSISIGKSILMKNLPNLAAHLLQECTIYLTSVFLSPDN